jgi:hypothetical protein
MVFLELNTTDEAEDEAKEPSLLIILLLNAIVEMELLLYTVKGENKRSRRYISVKVLSPDTGSRIVNIPPYQNRQRVVVANNGSYLPRTNYIILR